MNTEEVVDHLYNEFNITKKETRDLLDEITDCMVEKLEEGRRFTIPGLGTFDTHTRSSHVSYNPYYDAYLQIPPKRVVAYQAGRDLKSLLNSQSEDYE